MEEISLRNLPQRNVRVGSPISHIVTTADHNTPTRQYEKHHFPFYLPKQLFRWLYSISFVVISIFLIGFSAVMPIDAISQTIHSSNLALKTFVIVIACVLFVVIGAVLYVTRIYQSKLMMDDIPKRYIPGQSDLPRDVFREIQSTFKYTENIKTLAGPDEYIDHPGLSPPESVQMMNEKYAAPNSPLGTDLLPPDLLYEDVIRSIGDKLKIDSTFLNSDLKISKEMSFREHLLSMPKQQIMRRKAIYGNYVNSDSIPSFASSSSESSLYVPGTLELISIYEKLRFSGKLITQAEFVEFMNSLSVYVKNFHFVLQTDFTRDNDSSTQSVSPTENGSTQHSVGAKYWDQAQASHTNLSVSYNPRKGSSQTTSTNDKSSPYFPSEKLRRSSQTRSSGKKLLNSYAKVPVVKAPTNFVEEKIEAKKIHDYVDSNLSKQQSRSSHNNLGILGGRRFTGTDANSMNSDDDEDDYYNFRSKLKHYAVQNKKEVTGNVFKGSSESSENSYESDCGSVKIHTKDEFRSRNLSSNYERNRDESSNINEVTPNFNFNSESARDRSRSRSRSRARSRSRSPIKKFIRGKMKKKSFSFQEVSPANSGSLSSHDPGIDPLETDLPIFSPIKGLYKKQHKDNPDY